MVGKVVAVIPARSGSVGIPGKNIKLLGGVPLVARSIKTARAAKRIDEVYVSSDGDEILRVAEDYGAKPILRPAELSGGEASSEAALLHALQFIREIEGEDPAIIVFLQCTSPLTKAEEIDSVVSTLIDNQIESAFSAMHDHSFIWETDKNGLAVGVTHDASLPRDRRQDLVPRYRENGAIYAMNVAAFLKEGKRFCGRTMLVPFSGISVDVDSIEDWNLVESYLRTNETLEVG